MKALTLHQPWASLIALQVKTVETRGWSTSYRGPLAIHAGKHVEWCSVGDYVVLRDRDLPSRFPSALARWNPGHTEAESVCEMPLGAVVATCTLVDVVPILAGDQAERADMADLPYPRVESHPDFGPDYPDGWLELWHPTLGSAIDPEGYGRSIPYEAPYGDYSPGRFAWLLVDVVSFDPPVPAKGRQGLWDWDESA